MPNDKWFILKREKDYGKPYAKQAINIDDVAEFYAKKRHRVVAHYNSPNEYHEGYELYVHFKTDMKNPLCIDMEDSQKIMEWLRDIHDIDLFTEEE